MLTLAAVVIGAVLVVVAKTVREERIGDVPARVRAGDQVITGDGLMGVVREVHDTAACVRIGERDVWADRASLTVPWTPDYDGHVDVSAIEQDAPAAPKLVELEASSILGRLGARIASRAGRCVLAILAIVVICGALSGSLQTHLTGGGFSPHSDAYQMRHEVTKVYGQPTTALVVLSSEPLPVFKKQLDMSRAKVEAIPMVLKVGAPVASKDKKHVVSIITMSDLEDAAPSVDKIEAQLEQQHIKNLNIAGPPVVYRDIATATQADLTRAETIALPMALIILILVFGTLPAALVPLVVGIATVVTSLGVLRIITGIHVQSIYVMNITSMLGLGLGIDYSLLGVNRFRTELAAGRSVFDSVVRTTATAGMATCVSGGAVSIGLLGLFAFPVEFLHSIAISGIVVVSVAVIASITMVPAILMLLGRRIERFPVRRSVAQRDATSESRWLRLANGVMRKPVLSIAIAAVVLIALASGLTGVRLGAISEKVLPTSAPSIRGDAALEKAFGQSATPPIWIEVASTNPVQMKAYAAALGKLRGAKAVAIIGSKRGTTMVELSPDPDHADGVPGDNFLTKVMAVDAPGHARYGGNPSEARALVQTMSDHWKLMLLWTASATFLVLMAAFRSVVVPLKAIVLNIASIAAAIGCVAHVFMGGHFVHLLGTHRSDSIDVTLPAVLFGVLFGLSMDYEVFLLAAIAERYGAGADNAPATAQGLAKTAPMVTGAALILVAVGMAFTTAQIVIVKQIGFGLAMSLLIDATIVRCLLVPAFMRCMGDRNWWLPRGLSRLTPRISWSH